MLNASIKLSVSELTLTFKQSKYSFRICRFVFLFSFIQSNTVNIDQLVKRLFQHSADHKVL